MNYQNFVELARQNATTSASTTSYTFLHDTGHNLKEEVNTYSDIDRQARNIASYLQEHNCFGQRVLLLYPSGLEFIKAFLGCLYAGAVAVPAPLPTQKRQQLNRVLGIIRDADIKVILTGSTNVANISSWIEEEGLNQVSCIATDNLTLDLSNQWIQPRIESDHLAFLQYTSGSTSQPKGVMVSHKNLLSNEALIKKGFGFSKATKFTGWLPFYHDMGLIGNILQPLYLGIPAVFMSPMAFLKKPVRWLQAISDYQSTSSGGPNFAYDLCTRRVTDEQVARLDLSSWEVAFNGSEPIREETLRAFSQRFAIAGFNYKAFYPCYGLAECTLFVSGDLQTPTTLAVDPFYLEQNQIRIVSNQTDKKTTLLTSSGIVEDLNVAIVDPQTMERQSENQVGEVWVNGDSVAQGYWKLDELTEATFDAKISGEGQLNYLRTGDLGFFHRGKLFITGRIKELIILNGRNLYPYDIEKEVRELDPVFSGKAGAAFSVELDGRQELVIVQEVKSPLMSEAKLKELTFRVRQSVNQSFEVQVARVVLIEQATLPKTTSGKIQRKLTKNLFVDNNLEVICPEPVTKTRLLEKVV
jgi:acyl-CoA synthetase (AMP-forming)/AMP-acid ligase II